MNVIVKKSSIQGFGVYASKDFKKGENILIIDDTHIVIDESKLTPQQHEYDCDYLIHTTISPNYLISIYP